MHTVTGTHMGRQLYRPKNIGLHNIEAISALGVEGPEGGVVRAGRDWSRYDVCRNNTFSIVMLESFKGAKDEVGYTNQENYIKVNFWLSGRHTTVLDGFGQHDHDRPEVFITCGPQDTVKVDVLNRESRIAVVALCLLRDFFPTHMGVDPDDLPDPLRTMASRDAKPYGFHRLRLTTELASASRAMLSAPLGVRRDPLYGQAKCVELMCLLINMMGVDDNKHGVRLDADSRRDSRLYQAREMLNLRYAEPITLAQIAKEIGLNRMTLSSGFRELFSISVYDYLQRTRMERAFELLQDHDYSVAMVAEAVGFGHSCNFSTSFRSYFGCTPQQAREKRAL